jgi:hypothetical protein
MSQLYKYAPLDNKNESLGLDAMCLDNFNLFQKQFTIVANRLNESLLQCFDTTAAFIRVGCNLLYNHNSVTSGISIVPTNHSEYDNLEQYTIRTEDASGTIANHDDSSLKYKWTIKPIETVNGKSQARTPDKYYPKEVEANISKANYSLNDNENISIGQENNLNLITDNDIQHRGKPKVKLRKLSDPASSKRKYQKQREKVENKIPKHYNISNLNYYWPLDENHHLHRKEYISIVSQRKQNINIWNPGTNSNCIKLVESKSTSEIPKYTKKWQRTHLDTIQFSKSFLGQTYQEYQEKILQGEIHPDMSQIQKRTPKVPTLTPVQADGWTTVASKRIERRFDGIYEQISTTMIPRRLPMEKLGTDQLKPANTIHVLPLLIKITKSKKDPRTINKSRVLVAILQAMQNVYSDTYMIPKIGKEDKEHPNIYNINMVSTSDAIISDYFEYPEIVPNGSFTGRIELHTNHPLSDYKLNSGFSKYLAQEKIVLEEIRLSDVDPPNLGYIEELIPDSEILRMHTIRIRKYLPAGHPKFQLFVKTLYDSRRRSTKVVMVKCNISDIDTLQVMFNNLHKEKTIKFCSWKEFTSLNDVLRDVAVLKQFGLTNTIEVSE